MAYTVDCSAQCNFSVDKCEGMWFNKEKCNVLVGALREKDIAFLKNGCRAAIKTSDKL